MSKDRKIAETLAKFGEAFSESIWRVQGTPVIYHKTLERIAAHAGITFDVPTIVRAERDEAVLMVVGRMKDRMEWSLGEAVINVNYRVSGKQAAYVYAMAEKRGKDRVILKLIELSGLVYSEEEADEFKQQRPGARMVATGVMDMGEPDAAAEYIAECEEKVASLTDRAALLTWWNSKARKDAFRDFGVSTDQGQALHAKVIQKAGELAGSAVQEVA